MTVPSIMEYKQSASLNGKLLKLSSINAPPWVILPESRKGLPIKASEISGICYEIINTLKDYHNFSFVVETPADSDYGAKQMNGSWSGMMGMIMENQSDMAIGPVAVTIHRQEVADFTASFYQQPFSILIPSPTEDNRLWAALRPFQLIVWVLLIFAVTILPFITWLSFKWMMIRRAGLNDSSSMMNQLKSTYGILLTQSGQRISNGSSSLRILWTVWCLSSVIFIYAYVGSVTSFLSVPKLHPIIQSIYDLSSSSSASYRLVILRGSALEPLFMEANEGIYSYIGDRLRKNRDWLVENESDAVKAVIQRNSFFLRGQSHLDYLAEQDYKLTKMCRLSRAKFDFFIVSSAFVVTKGSPLKDIFNRKILQMIEGGLINHWIQKYWPSINECHHIYIHNQNTNKLNSNNARTHSLTMVDLQSAFLILGIGFGLAFTARLFEYLIFRSIQIS